jgi:micrococcal nuclease
MLAALVLAVLAALDNSCARRAPAIPQTAEQQLSFDRQRYHARPFIVTAVVDGDTLDIDAPDGNSPATRIRLWGVDTPETKNPRTGVMYFGPEAAAFTKDLVLHQQVTIYLEPDRNSRDRYNRLLAYVQLPDGTYLNERLLSEGLAYADVRFQHLYFNKYQQLESVARSAKKGLWQSVTPDQLPQWYRERKLKQARDSEVPAAGMRENADSDDVLITAGDSAE